MMSRLLVLLLIVAAVRAEADAKAEAKPKADAEPDYPPASYGPPPSYGAPPAPTYGAPKAAASYGPPPKPRNTCPKKCYDKVYYTTITKTAMEHHTHWNTYDQLVPYTLYKYVTETLYYPTTVVQYEFITQPLPDQVIYETKVAYNTGKINKIHVETKHDYMPGTHYYMKTQTESHYCTHTAQVPYYVTVTKHVYKTVQEPHYVTETKVEQHYVTVTKDEPHYVAHTKYATKANYMYVTVTETKHGYVTITHTVKKPEYKTVCPPKPSYGKGGYH
uniref:Extensin-2-like n=1 Tax=Hirondellea gigas TaxID=1518452 RepID=A0A2P2I2T4_9CRUS